METISENGMVVAKHPLAAAAGVEMLKKGGNAVDAAVATAFAVGVAEPFMSGIGGGGCMIIHLEGSEEDVNIDFITQVPSKAKPDMFELESGQAGADRGCVVKDNANLVGHRSILVPGTVAGLCLALEKYGTIELSDILQPAIRIAGEGVQGQQLYRSIHRPSYGGVHTFPRVVAHLPKGR